MKVSILSKQDEKFLNTPASIYVITSEEIRRSGEATLPELLKMVPGFDVGRYANNVWTTSARGFNGIYANKLLVLIDGRSVYNSFFSGVFWDQISLPVENIEKIEIIRGPGSSSWGANAVNGVVNIITKKPTDTQGGLVSGAFGYNANSGGTARYGNKISDRMNYRFSLSYLNFNGVEDPKEIENPDGYYGDFRVDFTPSESLSMILSGGFNENKANFSVSNKYYDENFVQLKDETESSLSGKYILARIKKDFGEKSSVNLNVSYSDDVLNGGYDTYLYRLNQDIESQVFDIDFYHDMQLHKRYNLMYGFGYKKITNKVDDTFHFSFSNPEEDLALYSAFLQNTIDILQDRLKLTIGAKLEDYDYTGTDISPTLRISYAPFKDHFFWASVTNARRKPSWTENSAEMLIQFFPPNFLYKGSRPTKVTLFGDENYKSEELWAYEMGYRFKVSDRMSVDISAFYNDYDELRTIEFQSIQMLQSFMQYHYIFDNQCYGQNYGFDISGIIDLTRWWRIYPGFSYINANFNLEKNSHSFTTRQINEEFMAAKQVKIRSLMDISKNIELDTMLYYSDAISLLDIGNYFNLIVRLGWKPTKNLEVSLVGKDLFDNKHKESRDEFVGYGETEVERGVYGKFTFTF